MYYLFILHMYVGGVGGVLMLLPTFGRPEDNLRESVLSSLCNYMLFYLRVRTHTHVFVKLSLYIFWVFDTAVKILVFNFNFWLLFASLNVLVLYLLFYAYVCIGGLHMPWCSFGGQRISLWNSVSHLFMWC